METDHLGSSARHIGVDPDEAFLKFLWDGKFAAIASDTRSVRPVHPDIPLTRRAVEVAPFRQPVFMHEVCLAGWGLPLGELFDLEALAAKCKELKRYTFFLSSEPMNVGSHGTGEGAWDRGVMELMIRCREVWPVRQTRSPSSDRWKSMDWGYSKMGFWWSMHDCHDGLWSLCWPIHYLFQLFPTSQ